MSRLAEAEKKLQQAVDALESALMAIPVSSPSGDGSPTADTPTANIPAIDTAAIAAEMQAIDGKIEQAMTLVAKAQANGAGAGEGE